MRDNILFQEENVDENRYRDVLDACCLNEDMKVFVDGDLTEVGEKGVTISGGQKQRIALARAAYCHADVTIVDDALSAMDSHVGGEVFRKCFMGMLKDTTRIFMTNNLMYTKDSDRVLLIENGKIQEQGTYEELMKLKGRFFEMMSHEVGMEEEEGEEKKADEKDEEKGHAEEDTKTAETKKKKDTPRKLMRKEQKTASRPSPFFMVTMAKSVDGEWMLILAGICFFLIPTLEWLQNYLLAKWVESSNQGDLSSNSVAFLIAAVVYAVCSFENFSHTLNQKSHSITGTGIRNCTRVSILLPAMLDMASS